MPYIFNPFTNNFDFYSSGGGGGGDVSGPGSSTDNAVVRWDGITGTLVKDSNVIVSDAGDISANSIDLTVPLDETDGGTGQSSYATGDILYSSASNTLTKLPIGTDNKVLTVIGGIPSWETPAASGVTSVSGTADRITSTGGTTPVIDIAGTYVGQTSITTLGTIATGTWQGTAVDATHGGTAQTSWTTGDMLYASASNTLSKLTAGTIGSQQVITDSGIPAWNTGIGGPDIIYFEDDFFYYQVADGPLGPWSNNRNSGQTYPLGSTSSHPGVVQLSTSTTVNAEDSFRKVTSFVLAGGFIRFVTIINIPTLATVSEDYTMTIGLGDAIGSFLTPPGNNAVYFQYNRSSSTNWIMGTKSGGSFTSSSGSLPAVTTGWHTLAFDINAAASTVTFYVDGITIGTSSTNIPSSSMSLGYYIKKTAGSSDCVFNVDYCKYYQKLTTSRF